MGTGYLFNARAKSNSYRKLSYQRGYAKACAHAAGLLEPSKTHLRDILAEAVRNTAQPQKTNPRVPDGQEGA